MPEFSDKNTAEQPSPDKDQNLTVFDDEQIASFYDAMEGLSACETVLFEAHVNGDAVLDLGVGAGRTTPKLSELADSYVGLDYSPAMIDVCRRKYPQQAFVVADAADLSQFESSSFDVVVFSFNGIDCLPDDAVK